MISSRLFRAAILFFACPLVAQMSVPPFAKVYAGKDGLAHVVDRSGKDVAIDRATKQVGVDLPLLSRDRNFAGWEIDEENCCTSYPIPTQIALYSGTGTRLVRDGMMIYDWCFVPGKAQVAVSTGTVHGWEGGQNLHLYDASSGRRLLAWFGKDGAAKPKWARCLK